MNFRIYSTFCFVMIAFSLVNAIPALAIVKVGNGGDVIAAQLLSTAKVLREVLISEGRGTNVLTQACSELPELSDAQKMECRTFVSSALRDILPLVLNNSTPLLLTRELLEVPGPDGKPRPVQAYTQCAGNFPITFAFDSVKLFSPSQLLQLLLHEFGHKVRYQSGDCLQDDLPVGAFDTPGGSRVLLDSFGMAVVSAALKLSLITEEVGVQDIFKCIWKVGTFEFKQTVFTNVDGQLNFGILKADCQLKSCTPGS